MNQLSTGSASSSSGATESADSNPINSQSGSYSSSKNRDQENSSKNNSDHLNIYCPNGQDQNREPNAPRRPPTPSAKSVSKTSTLSIGMTPPPPRPPQPTSSLSGHISLTSNQLSGHHQHQDSKPDSKHGGSHIYLNPVFESATYIKTKRIFKRFKKRMAGDDEDNGMESDQEDDVKSLSMDSVYITPVVEQEIPKVLINATNYFVGLAIFISFILVFVAFYLILGEP